jgi:adenylate kinase
MEDDYRKRKSHPNYKDHLNVEKLVMKAGGETDTAVKTYVINSGVVYHPDDGLIHNFLKVRSKLQEFRNIIL